MLNNSSFHVTIYVPGFFITVSRGVLVRRLEDFLNSQPISDGVKGGYRTTLGGFEEEAGGVLRCLFGC